VLEWLTPKKDHNALDWAELDGKVAEPWREVIWADFELVRAKHGDGRSIAGYSRLLGELYQQRAAHDRQRIERVVAYAREKQCLVAEILRYLDEAEGALCGRCRNCDERGKLVHRRAKRGSAAARQ
jgi:superfamily II DNA helicase RecQ